MYKAAVVPGWANGARNITNGIPFATPICKVLQLTEARALTPALQAEAAWFPGMRRNTAESATRRAYHPGFTAIYPEKPAPGLSDMAANPCRCDAASAGTKRRGGVGSQQFGNT